jgi:hypothetical protein
VSTKNISRPKGGCFCLHGSGFLQLLCSQDSACKPICNQYFANSFSWCPSVFKILVTPGGEAVDYLSVNSTERKPSDLNRFSSKQAKFYRSLRTVAVF